MRRIMPRQRKARALTAKFSKSLASLRQRPSHANVLSTIQRLARGTKPSASPRLTISSRQPPRRAQQRDGTVPVLDVGGMDRGAQQQAQRVDQDVPLLALDLLARVVTAGIDVRPP